MARKINDSEVEFIEKSLIDLNVQLDNIKTYLDGNPWINIQDENKQQREFKFQASLYDKYNVWLEKYMELSGIIDYYNEANAEKDDKLRKGYKDNALMDMIQDGTMGVDDYSEGR